MTRSVRSPFPKQERGHTRAEAYEFARRRARERRERVLVHLAAAIVTVGTVGVLVALLGR